MQEFGKKQKIVIGMVGLPARGKTYISIKICSYFNELGYKSKVFNIGNYRRQRCGTDCDSSFFDPSNAESTKARDQCAILALNDMIGFLKAEGDVSLYDGTNTTKQRRKLVMETLKEKFEEVQVFWVESICNDEQVIQRNIKLTKLNNPDYANKPQEEATRDFLQRIEQYQKVYQPIEEDENISFIKIIDLGKEIIIHDIQGYLQSKIVQFLMNLHIYPHPTYFYSKGNRIQVDPSSGLLQELEQREQSLK